MICGKPCTVTCGMREGYCCLLLNYKASQDQKAFYTLLQSNMTKVDLYIHVYQLLIETYASKSMCCCLQAVDFGQNVMEYIQLKERELQSGTQFVYLIKLKYTHKGVA